MPIPILMPALSPTMEEGTLSRWMVKEGDAVQPGDVIAEIETDKATMEVEAVEEGTLGRILIGEGTEGVAVNKPIAVLLEEGESADALEGYQPEAGGETAKPEAPKQEEQPTQAEQPAQAESAAAAPQTARAEAAPESAPAPAAEPPSEPREPQARTNGDGRAQPGAETAARNGRDGRIFASPLARRLAEENSIDLAALAGSGPRGRVIKRDIEKALQEGVAPEAEPSEPSAPGREVATAKAPPAVSPMSDEEVFQLYEQGSYEVVPHDNMRKRIAERLTVAKSTIPHFYLSADCRIDALLAARKRLNAMSAEEGPQAFKISVNDMVIKAMAMALQKVPAANATWTEEGILRHRYSDIGVAVAVEGGLFTPILRHAELKSLSEIANEMLDLAERARKRRLAPHEYQGGTTAISNLGMYGVKSFDAVINPPHATILAVGAGERQPVIEGDDIRIATVMNCTLSCDHRVVDGALGAELLDAFRGFIEEPVTMLV